MTFGGSGTGVINFNHTATDYVFAPTISGPGKVNVFSGTTILTGNNTYSKGTTIEEVFSLQAHLLPSAPGMSF